MPVLYDRLTGFQTYFNRQTGFYARTDLLDATGRETGRQPLMATWPHLLDIGIMGHCDHAATGQCQAAGVACYQQGGRVVEPNMSLADFTRILSQVAGLVFQVALGGRGDPDCHEDFAAMLAGCQDVGIVANYTTSGYRVNRQTAELSRRYCGAVAVSWYDPQQARRAMDCFLDAGVKTNVHFVLTSDTLDRAIALLQNPAALQGINAILFLLHKPVGLGQAAQVVRTDHPRLTEFLQLIAAGRLDGAFRLPFQVGFDTCSYPVLIEQDWPIAPESIDTCEAARFAAYISPTLQMTPCSFAGGPDFAVDLRQQSVLAAWHSPAFDRFREHFRNSCPDCPRQADCLGGCPVVPEIVLCRHRADVPRPMTTQESVRRTAGGRP